MIKRVTFYGLMISIAFILSYIESLFPIFISIPGIKLGLANIVIVIALYIKGSSSAIYIALTRILLIAITFGNFSLFMYSFAGTALSLILMIIIKKIGLFNIITVSIMGALAHNIGQIIMAMILISTFNLMYYLPILMIAGIITGLIIGIICIEIKKRIKFERSF